jgi:hypothetical protein
MKYMHQIWIKLMVELLREKWFQMTLNSNLIVYSHQNIPKGQELQKENFLILRCLSITIDIFILFIYIIG